MAERIFQKEPIQHKLPDEDLLDRGIASGGEMRWREMGLLMTERIYYQQLVGAVELRLAREAVEDQVEERSQWENQKTLFIDSACGLKILVVGVNCYLALH